MRAKDAVKRAGNGIGDGRALARLRRMRGWRPRDREELRAWAAVFLGLRMPERAVCGHHQTPLDYLAHSFFEGAEGAGDGIVRPADTVVWACRGGGKTMMGAAATLLDLLFKPGIQVRILGGSFEQSEKMYEYLVRLVRRHFGDLLAGEPTQRRLVLRNGSRVDVLAQSDRSVRGQRVQKLRCDEVELFTPEVWEAAQLTTRSGEGESGGLAVRGAVEAFSTMHKPGGLMQRIMAEAGGSGSRSVFTWCVWDVMERCPAERSCGGCPLWEECGGRAKAGNGFVKIDDVIAMRGRVSRATWEHEMLCMPPVHEDAVFGTFRRAAHVRSAGGLEFLPGAVIGLEGREFVVEGVVCGVDFGFAHAFVGLWIVMMREVGGGRAAWVVDELVTRERTVGQNAAAMRERGWRALAAYCDVAGRQTNSQTGRTDESILREAGFETRARMMEIRPGVEMIRDLLSPADGGARLFIDPRCARLIEAMEGYRMGRDGVPEKDGRQDHLIDALRYAVAGHEGMGGRVEVRGY